MVLCTMMPLLSRHPYLSHMSPHCTPSPAFVSYFVNHPLFTPPPETWVRSCTAHRCPPGMLRSLRWLPQGAASRAVAAVPLSSKDQRSLPMLASHALALADSNVRARACAAPPAGQARSLLPMPTVSLPPPPQTLYALAAALLCQLGNLRCHVILSGLRPGGASAAGAGAKTRAGAATAAGAARGYSIPRGFLFNYITCANYTCEIAGWACFTIATHVSPDGPGADARQAESAGLSCR